MENMDTGVWEPRLEGLERAWKASKGSWGHEGDTTLLQKLPKAVRGENTPASAIHLFPTAD